MPPDNARHLRDKHPDFDDGVVVVDRAMGVSIGPILRPVVRADAQDCGTSDITVKGERPAVLKNF